MCDVRSGSNSEVVVGPGDFRLSPSNGHSSACSARPFRANRQHFALQHIGEIRQRPICPMLSPAEPNLIVSSYAFFSKLGQQECFHIRRHRVTSQNLWPKSDWRRGDQLFR